jgi:dipeptidyl-peptidase 4
MKKYFLVCFIVAIATTNSVTAKSNLTLEDIWTSKKFSSRSVKEVEWLKGDSVYSFVDLDTVSRTRGVFLYSVATGTKRLVVSSASLHTYGSDSPMAFSSYLWSPDGRSIVFVSEPPDLRYLSRLTPDGNYFLYDTTTHALKQLTNVNVPQYNHKFSPDGKTFGFVRGNNIYTFDLATGKETQRTFDGSDVILNGKSDWAYEEELDFSDAWMWSADSKQIAYWRFDDTRIPVYTLTEWDSLHQTLIPMRYPKAGDPIASVMAGVMTLSTGKTVWMNTGTNNNQYIARMQWTEDQSTIALQVLNRQQNKLELLYADVATGLSKMMLTERSEQWVELRNDLTFLRDGSFIWGSDRDGFMHFYLYKKDGTLIRQITKGNWDADKFYGVDEKSGTLFYSSSETTPSDRNIYAIGLDGSGKKRLTPENGTHEAHFADGSGSFIDTYSTISMPPKVRLITVKSGGITVLENNPMPALASYALGRTKFFTIRTSDSLELDASLLVPDDFDSTKTYPVLVYTYGGPGIQVVLNKWGGANELWHSLLVEKGYLIFKVDNRGTGARGAAFMKSVYQNLGKWEVHDQIEGAKYLASLPYVDKKRIGIWGWSYGGYMSSMCILNGADYFKTAIAVAPVTSWRYYDAPYTERYMNLPEQNAAGYTNSSPLSIVDKLRGKFLLIHGTSDDNVHFQNTANFVKALEGANKQFTTMFYPDKNHSIVGSETRLHLFTLMTNFLLENL